MEGQRGSDSATSRSGSRKRERSTSPVPEFKKPSKIRDSRPAKKQNNSRPVVDKVQPKITSYKRKNSEEEEETVSNMAEKTGETVLGKPLSEFEKLVLEKLQGLETKVENMDKKLDLRMDGLESRIFDLEQAKDAQKKEIEEVAKQQNVSVDLITSNETIAKTSHEKASANEQYLRNYNVRIFNLHEVENESIEQCEEKVLKLFNETMKVKVSIDAIDVLHRVGKKKPKAQNKTNEQSKDRPKPGDEKSKEKETHVNLEQNNNINDNTKKDKQNDSQSNRSSTSKKESDKDSDSDEETEPERPVIVRFLSRRIRREVLENRSRLKENLRPGKKPVAIVEDLTKHNYTLLMRAKHSEKFESAWTRDGNVFGRQSLNGVHVPIKTMSDIDCPPVPRSEGFTAHFKSTRGRGNYRGRGRGFVRGQARYGRGSGRSQNSGGDGETVQLNNRFENLQNDKNSDIEMSSKSGVGIFD